MEEVGDNSTESSAPPSTPTELRLLCIIFGIPPRPTEQEALTAIHTKVDAVLDMGLPEEAAYNLVRKIYHNCGALIEEIKTKPLLR